MISKIVLLLAAVALVAEAQGPASRTDFERHQTIHRRHQEEFNRFMTVTKGCLTELMPKSGMSEEQQKTLLDMIKPIHVLEHEMHELMHETATTEGDDKKVPKNRPRFRVYEQPPPPFKCTAESKVVPLTPAEIYVEAMTRIIQSHPKITERDQAQEAMKQSLPCIDKMFIKKNEPAAEEKAAEEKPAGR